MKQIIILKQVRREGAAIELEYVLWAPVPVARQPFYADALRESAYKDLTQVELDALRAGQVAEYATTGSWPAGTTNPTIRAEMEALWAEFNTQVQTLNPWNRYGSFWDGTAWTVGGVA